MSASWRVPFLRPPFGIEERYAAYKTLCSADVSTGQERAWFEKDFREYIGVPYSLAVANGTIALELIWQTFIQNGKLSPGDKVLVPSFTFVAVANAIRASGLVPVFCDINKRDWNMDISGYFHKYCHCKAVCAVHTFGNPVDMYTLLKFQEQFDTILVEDCAECCGATYNHFKAGSFGDAASFSFNATKNLTTGEGGMSCFQDKEDADTALLLAENGFGYSSRNAQIVGHNYRLSNIQCSIGIQQLKKLTANNNSRKRNARILIDALQDTGIQFQQVNGDHVYQIFGMVLEDNKQREMLYNHLIKNGVECKKYFDPTIHLQDAYAQYNLQLPVTEDISSRILCLPLDAKISVRELGYMVYKIKEVI